MTTIVRLRPGAPRPWASARHRSRYGLAERIRREYLGGADGHLPDDDVLALVPPAARRDVLGRSDGRG